MRLPSTCSKVEYSIGERTPTSDRLLADAELRDSYEGSKTPMYVFDRFEETVLVLELLNGMYTELPEKKPAKAR